MYYYTNAFDYAVHKSISIGSFYDILIDAEIDWWELRHAIEAGYNYAGYPATMNLPQIGDIGPVLFSEQVLEFEKDWNIYPNKDMSEYVEDIFGAEHRSRGVMIDVGRYLGDCEVFIFRIIRNLYTPDEKICSLNSSDPDEIRKFVMDTFRAFRLVSLVKELTNVS